MIPGFLIGTAILWGLTLFLVEPLARRMAEGEMAIQPVENEAGEVIGEEVPSRFYVGAGLIVMTVAGLLIGLVSGYFFLGIAWSWRLWPGLLAFIAASFVGAALNYA